MHDRAVIRNHQIGIGIVVLVYEERVKKGLNRKVHGSGEGFEMIACTVEVKAKKQAKFILKHIICVLFGKQSHFFIEFEWFKTVMWAKI